MFSMSHNSQNSLLLRGINNYMDEKTKEYILVTIGIVIIITLCLLSIQEVGETESRKLYFPLRIGSGVR